MGRHVVGDEAVTEGELVEAADRRRASPEARGREPWVDGRPRFVARREVANGASGPRRPVARRAPRSSEVIEIGSIGTERRRGEAPLDAQEGQVVLDRPVEVDACRLPCLAGSAPGARLTADDRRRGRPARVSELAPRASDAPTSRARQRASPSASTTGAAPPGLGGVEQFAGRGQRRAAPPPCTGASPASSTIRPSRSRRVTSVTVRPSRSRFTIR